MTRLEKKILRVLAEPIERDNWAVEIDRVGITFRRTGSRLRYPTVPWARIWRYAIDMEVARVRKEKAEKRKLKKGLKR
jgi:hypothetical protein